MLRCCHGFQPDLRPDFYWPVLSLRPRLGPPLQQQDLLQELLKEMEPFQTGVTLDREGQRFGLTLNTQGFSPEDLSVRQAGRKLRVSGRKEKKQEDHQGSCSYRRQEFRREFDLPEGLNPEDVSCYLDPDGKLHIQAAGAPREEEEPERELTIRRSCEEKPQTAEHMDSSTCSNNTL